MTVTATRTDEARIIKRQPRGSLVLDVIVFSALTIVGLARLPEPFFGDQALNALMGKVIANGGAPYADLWDLKHPGVFFFFAAGGMLFGFSEVGIHLFELLWMLATALAVRVIAGRWLPNRAAASLAPALTVGIYYAFTTSYHLTQTEALIGLPLALSLVALSAALRGTCRRPSAWLFASGLAGGVVVVFKMPYGVVPALFWVLGLVEWRRTHEGELRRGVRAIGVPVLAGFVTPLSATAAYLAYKGVLGLALWTFFVHPGVEASNGGINVERLADSVEWFARTFSVVLSLAVIGAWDRLRRGWGLLTAALVTWVGSGVLVITMQVISWWPYHFLALLIPIGLLAAQGADTLWLAATRRGAERWHRAVATAALLLVSALLFRHLQPVPGLVATTFGARPLPFDGASMRAFQASRDDDYAALLATTSFLRQPNAHAGPIYVFGNPNLYLLADRRPAVPLLVWGTSPPVGRWNELMADLSDASPDYVFVSEQTLETMIHFIPPIVTERQVIALRHWLEERYDTFRTDSPGTWYLRQDLTV